MLLLGLVFEDITKNRATVNAVVSVLYLGIFGSFLTFSFYYWLLQKISLVMLSVIAFITPVVAVLTGMIVNNEVLNSNQIFGSVFVLTGLLLPQLIKQKGKVV